MVFIHKFNKNIFPNYVPPLTDELFSSWLCRLAYSHKIKTNTFINNYLESNYPIWNRDIDCLAPDKLIEILEQHTPLSRTDINNLFFMSLVGYAFEKLPTHTSSKYVLSLGINHRTRKHYGQQCCTGCLSKETPYYKRKWRLGSSIICVDCNEYLIDRCFNCHSPITFFRINMGGNKIKSTMEFEPMFLCYNCKIDLRKYIPVKQPSSIELEYQVFIDNTINNGFNSMTMYSFTYMRVLYLLALRLRSNTVKNRFRDAISNILNCELGQYDGEIHLWDIQKRIDTFPLVYSLLKLPKEDLYAILKKGRVHKSYLVKDNDPIPYWFYQLLLY